MLTSFQRRPSRRPCSCSIVFGITQRAQPRMMIRFGAFCFVMFVGITIAASWLMWAIKH